MVDGAASLILLVRLLGLFVLCIDDLYCYLQLCEGQSGIDRIANVTPTMMADDYITREVPVILQDGLENWKALSMFNIHFLSDVSL